MRIPIFLGYLGPILGSLFALLFAVMVFVRDLSGDQTSDDLTKKEV